MFVLFFFYTELTYCEIFAGSDSGEGWLSFGSPSIPSKNAGFLDTNHPCGEFNRKSEAQADLSSIFGLPYTIPLV